MIKIFILIFMLYFSINTFSQEKLLKGNIITEKNDTLYGELKNKNYYLAKKVKLYSNNKFILFTKQNIKEININGELYRKCDLEILSNSFFKKRTYGLINIYQNRERILLGVYDNDINFGFLKSSIKFYCDDYPNLIDSIRNINKINIDSFLINYNKWKEENSSSKSFYEENFHKRKFLNLNISFLLPGAGVELGFTKNITFNSMIKSEFGYSSNLGFSLNPFLDNQIRYYYNFIKRKENKKRTYNYTGNFICLIHMYSFLENYNLIGFEYGWQRTVGRNWYSKFDFGIGRQIENDIIALMIDIDLGYKF